MTQDNARKFTVSKTLELPLIQEKAGRHLDTKETKKIFAKHPRFTKAYGCYVFGIRAAKGYKPIYVGKTTKQTLGEEALSDGTIRKINEAILKTRRATLVVAFVVPDTKPGACPQTAIDEIEITLIQYACQKNPAIENEYGIYRCGWYIDGVLNRTQGRPTADAQTFRQLVGIPKYKMPEPNSVLKNRQKKTHLKTKKCK